MFKRLRPTIRQATNNRKRTRGRMRFQFATGYAFERGGPIHEYVRRLDKKILSTKRVIESYKQKQKTGSRFVSTEILEWEAYLSTLLDQRKKYPI